MDYKADSRQNEQRPEKARPIGGYLPDGFVAPDVIRTDVNYTNNPKPDLFRKGLCDLLHGF